MARYDFGWRGARESATPRRWAWTGLPYDEHFRRRRIPPSTRITAPYNLDYVRDLGPRFPRNPNPYAGEWYDQMISEDEYRPPYITRTGTHTRRGVPRQSRPSYDFRNFGPDYGGIYPDEV